MKEGISMIIPKNDIKYRSVKSYKWRGTREIEKKLQHLCYDGYIDLKCGQKKVLCRNCWFRNLKPDYKLK